jgi:hypothetical protein
MAKKSAASLSVVPVKPKDARIAPPSFLTARQKELWLEIVASKPADWFTEDCKALLVGYVKAIASHEILSRRVDILESDDYESIEDLKDEDRLYAMQERQARLIQSFATKMRLTNQSRYQNSTAAVKSSKAGAARPWD